MTEIREKAVEGTPAPALLRCSIAVGLIWFHLLIFGRLGREGFFGTTKGIVIAAIGGVVALFLFHRRRRAILRWLNSMPFAATILVALMILTMLGTLVVQGLSPEQFEAKYGGAVAAILKYLDADDIFHSVPFNGLLALLCVSLTWVALKRKFWQLPHWGFLLSHGGVVAVLIGGVVGGVAGARGFIDMHEGESVATARPLDGKGGPIPLGFEIKLEKFEVERYPADYRFYAYEPKEGGGYKIVWWARPGDSAEWRPVAGTEVEFRSLKVLAGFLTGVRAMEGRPPLHLRYERPNARHPQITLIEGVPGRDEVRVEPLNARVKYVWSVESAKPAPAEQAIPEKHVVEFRAHGKAEPVEVEVVPGKSCPIPGAGYDVSVLEFFPDFVKGSGTGEPGNRSPHPNNPAIKLRVHNEETGEAEERWLFSKYPEFGRMHDKPEDKGPVMVYRYEPARVPIEREVFVVGETREVFDYRSGRLLSRKPMPEEPGAEVAERLPVEFEAAAEIEVRSGDRERKLILPAGVPNAFTLTDGSTIFLFDRKPGEEVSAYRSRLSVHEEGRKVSEGTSEVNGSFSYGGFRFYQSNWRPEDPTYAGLLVVKAPGLPIVYAGFVMICAGVIFIFYIRPLVRRRRVGGAS